MLQHLVHKTSSLLMVQFLSIERIWSQIFLTNEFVPGKSLESDLKRNIISYKSSA